MDEAWDFSKKLSRVGMSITRYKEFTLWPMKRGEFLIYILNYLTHIGAIQTWLTLNLGNTKTTSSS